MSLKINILETDFTFLKFGYFFSYIPPNLFVQEKRSYKKKKKTEKHLFSRKEGVIRIPIEFFPFPTKNQSRDMCFVICASLFPARHYHSAKCQEITLF